MFQTTNQFWRKSFSEVWQSVDPVPPFRQIWSGIAVENPTKSWWFYTLAFPSCWGFGGILLGLDLMGNINELRVSLESIWVYPESKIYQNQICHPDFTQKTSWLKGFGTLWQLYITVENSMLFSMCKSSSKNLSFSRDMLNQPETSCSWRRYPKGHFTVLISNTVQQSWSFSTSQSKIALGCLNIWHP